MIKTNIHTICICILLFATSCEQEDKHPENKKGNIITEQATDSILLLKHLDSLPKVNLPFLSEFYNREFSEIIDLSEFKAKKLFNIPFNRIERVIGGGLIDDNPKDTTFNLTDDNYKAKWNLIAKTPKFIVLEVYTGYAFFVTITYDLKVIDAIRSGYADPLGNVHWQADRHSIINKDLSIILQHYFAQTIDNNNYDDETIEEEWFIDSDGYFKQK